VKRVVVKTSVLEPSHPRPVIRVLDPADLLMGLSNLSKHPVVIEAGDASIDFLREFGAICREVNRQTSNIPNEILTVFVSDCRRVFLVFLDWELVVLLAEEKVPILIVISASALRQDSSAVVRPTQYPDKIANTCPHGTELHAFAAKDRYPEVAIPNFINFDICFFPIAGGRSGMSSSKIFRKYSS